MRKRKVQNSFEQKDRDGQKDDHEERHRDSNKNVMKKKGLMIGKQQRTNKVTKMMIRKT